MIFANFIVQISNIDGSKINKLTDHLAEDFQPSFSQDGNNIVFTSGRDRSASEADIYIKDLDINNILRLTYEPVNDCNPHWSPDGTQIVFQHHTLGYDADIHIMNADGSNLRNLTNNEYSDVEPYWSPDGNYIVFSSNRDGISEGVSYSYEIYIINTDGSNLRRLTNNSIDDRNPSWSPY